MRDVFMVHWFMTTRERVTNVLHTRVTAVTLAAFALLTACGADGGETATSTTVAVASSTAQPTAELPGSAVLPDGEVSTPRQSANAWAATVSIDTPFSTFDNNALVYAWNDSTVRKYKAAGYEIVNEAASSGTLDVQNDRYRIHLAARARDAHRTDVAVTVTAR